MEDGTRPNQPVQVQLVCHGAVRQQVGSHHGQFSFDVGTNRNATLSDASVSGAPSDDQFFDSASLDGATSVGPKGHSMDLSGCELRASLPGFGSEVIRLGRRQALDNPQVGEIVLFRLEGVTGSTISVNTSRAPKQAKKAFHKAEDELKKKKPDPARAARELEKAVREFPEFSAAWYLLGEVRLVLQDPDGAQQAFQKAIASDAKYITPYLSLAGLEVNRGHWEKTARLSRQVIELNPYVIRAHYLNAAANYALGNLDIAEESARRVAEDQEVRNYPQTWFILGGILAQKDNVSSATAEFRHFLEVQPEGPLAERVKLILSQWKEQGLMGKELAKEIPKD